MLVAEFFQNIRGSGTLFGLAAPARRLQIQFVEQNFGQLRGGIHVEFRTGECPDVLLEAANFLLHGLGHFREGLGIDANARALDLRKYSGERQIDFFVNVGEALFFYLFAKDGSESLQKIGAFTGSTTHRHIEIAEDDVSKFVLGGGGTEKVVVELRGVFYFFSPAGEQLEQFGIVDDFPSLGIAQSGLQALESFAFFIGPYRSTFTGFRRDFDAGEVRAEAFGLATAQIEIEPESERHFRGHLLQVALQLVRIGKLEIISFFSFRGSGGTTVVCRRRRQAFLERATGEQFFQQGVEAQFAIELHQLRGIGITHPQFLQIQFQRNFGFNGGELFAHQHLFFLLLQRFAITLVWNFVGVGECVLHRAVFLNQFGGALFADSFCSGNVVDGVAEQRHQINDLCGRHAENFFHFCGVDDGVRLGAARTGTQNAHAGVDELHHVLVVADDQHVEIVRRGLLCQGADDIVGFIAIQFQNRHAHGLAKAADVGKLHTHLVGHGRAMGFVRFEELVAEGRLAGIENDSDVVRFVILNETSQDVGE